MKRACMKVLAAVAVSGSLGVTPASAADAWPTRPITLVVPFAPGGTTDLLGRLVAEGLSKGLHESVVVENKPGAGANIGANFVARSAPDGYTLMLGTPGPLAINTHIYKDMPFDPATAFTAVSYMADVPNVILGYPGTGIKDIKGLLEYAKAHPGRLNWGSPGVGSTGHIMLELLKQLSGADIVHVPFKGGSQAAADLVAGHIQLAGDNVPTALELIRSGKEVALGVASEKELDVLPGVKPVNETVPGFILPSWFVVVAPAGTPKDVVDRISGVIDAYIKEPATVAKLKSLGAVPVGGPPEKLDALLKSERVRFGKLLSSMKDTVQ